MALDVRVSTEALAEAEGDALVLLVPHFAAGADGGAAKAGARGSKRKARAKVPRGSASRVERLVASAGRDFAEGFATLVERKAFVGDEGQVRTLTVGSRSRFPTLVLVGIGAEDKVTSESVRKAVAAGCKSVRELGCRSASVATVAGHGALEADRFAEAAAEGAHLGLYRFEDYKGEKSKTELRRVTLLVPSASRASAARAAETGVALGEAVNLCRDLGNEPANVATPTYLARRATEMARKNRLSARVFEAADMRRMGMGALLGVAQGSHEPPKLIMLTYEPPARAKAPTVVLVGKGLTFDTGGISIKPAAKMEDMKFDMCGGAAVIASLYAAARLRVKVRVVGLVPSSENMPGGGSYKPGDILRAMNGVTIEVKNTDAEGRLILADALAYASTRLDPKPQAIIDLATLTGACVVALGDQCAGLVSNDDALSRRIEEAAERSGDPVWRLPLKAGYREQMKSTYADLSNLGGSGAGALTAAAFLERFVGDVPWAHLDIAGVAWGERETALSRVGATGFGVRAMARMLADWR
jgi:leucyl aminopeptidase